MADGLLGKNHTMKVICLVQARMTSTRLPGKIMFDLRGIPVIGRILHSLGKCSQINKIVVVTTTNSQDDVLVNYLKKNNYEIFRGSENDVLDRFVNAAEKYSPDFVVRITADCPLVDPKIVDKVIDIAIKMDIDYASNTLKRTFPDGYDVEVVKFSTLKKINLITKDEAEREHVTLYLVNNQEKFNVINLEAKEKHPDWRVTLDNMEDYKLIKKIDNSYPEKDVIYYEDVIKLFLNRPELITINSKFSLYK